MEMHAHVPKVGRTLSHWLLEGVFIVLSIALGFGVTQLREEHQNRELAARVLKGIEAEMQSNLSLLEPFADVQDKWIDAMAKLGDATDRPSGFPVCPTTSTACGVYFATRPDLGTLKSSFPSFQRAAWDTALSTGALRLLDYDLVAALSGVYQRQEQFRKDVDNVGVSSTDWYDSRARDAAVRRLYMAMVELQFDERQGLLPLYRKYVPLVSAAANAR
jgi:hypothetical protein